VFYAHCSYKSERNLRRKRPSSSWSAAFANSDLTMPPKHQVVLDHALSIPGTLTHSIRYARLFTHSQPYRDHEISWKTGDTGFKQSSPERHPQDPGEPCSASPQALLHVYPRHRDWIPKSCPRRLRRICHSPRSVMCMNTPCRLLRRRR
jgi:hypothetical protein